MRKQQGFSAPELIIAVVVLAGIVGWVMNIFDIVAAVSGPITAMFILRCVGIFVAPLGAILGYF